MKQKISKKITSIILALIFVCSSVFTLNFRANAADSEQINASYAKSTVGSDNNFVTDATEPSADIDDDFNIPTEIKPHIGKIKSISKTSFKSNSITLTWDKVDGVTGYSVYYCNADKSKTYTKYGNVTSNTVTVTGLSAGTQYHFKINAYLLQGDSLYEGESTIKKTATQTGKVAGLRLTRSSEVVEIKWSKMAVATGYRVYRACGATNWKYKLVKTLKNPNSTTYTDTSVKVNNQYRYRVAAYRELYSSSVYSSLEYTTIVAFSGLGALSVSTKSQLSRVSLSWNKNKYAEGYGVYYSTKSTGTFTRLGTTKNNFFNTTKLTPGKTYYFRVFPYVYRSVSGKNTRILGTYRTYSAKVQSKIYNKDVGNTYVEISLKQQHMWYYKNGKLITETDVVTGNDDGYHNTPKGIYKIFQRVKHTTLVGADYVSYVDYWLGFTSSGIGIHDSSWRSSKEYGGTTYKGNGSHGCVNTPYKAVKKIYDNISKGTYVVLY